MIASPFAGTSAFSMTRPTNGRANGCSKWRDRSFNSWARRARRGVISPGYRTARHASNAASTTRTTKLSVWLAVRSRPRPVK